MDRMICCPMLASVGLLDKLHAEEIVALWYENSSVAKMPFPVNYPWSSDHPM
jgi:hypothetical protein